MPMLNQDVEPKQPAEAKYYTGDWRKRLAAFPGVTIVASVWDVIGGDGALVKSNEAIDGTGTITSVLFGGGTAGAVYTVRNSVTLSDAQVWRGYGVLEVAAEATLLRT